MKRYLARTCGCRIDLSTFYQSETRRWDEPVHPYCLKISTNSYISLSSTILVVFLAISGASSSGTGYSSTSISSSSFSIRSSLPSQFSTVDRGVKNFCMIESNIVSNGSMRCAGVSKSAVTACFPCRGTYGEVSVDTVGCVTSSNADFPKISCRILFFLGRLVSPVI